MALGDFIDDVKETINQQKEVSCVMDAQNNPSVADMDAKVMDLAANWHPTGYFTVDEIHAMVGQIKQADATVLAQVILSSKSTSDADTVIKQAVDYINTNEARAQVYLDAAAQAQNQGLRAVYAPGFKTFVTNSMVNISQAYTTRAALDCQTTWFDTAAGVITGLWNVAKSIGSLVLQAGEDAVHAAEGFTQFLKNTWPYARWVILGAVVLWGALRVREIGRGSLLWREAGEPAWKRLKAFAHKE